ncbi:peptide transporter [Clostridium sp.]|uniref:ornithine carbamoyltransferase n=1 Tax=Clostridium sp. TaxID=1506 RepID=UPI003216F121
MKNLIRLCDYTKEEIFKIFNIADEIEQGKYENCLKGKTIVLFFPNSSIRTRVTFEKGTNMLGGQSILFPSDALDKKEEIKDVVGYLNNWVDCLIVRHRDISLINEMAAYSSVPVINAMTSVNHPCEVLSDLYALCKLRENFLELNYLFVGAKENIGLAWNEAAQLLGFSLTQCCPNNHEMDDIPIENDITKAFLNKDIILTDPVSEEILKDFKEYQVTTELMNLANKDALLNPCPPFYRGKEVSVDVIDSEYFIRYEFKKTLLNVQQAIIIFNMQNF